MQYLKSKNTESSWNTFQLTKYLLLVVGSLFIYFMPALHEFWRQVDFSTYSVLNQSLEYSRAWQLFWGYLNHPNENWLNLVAMGALNVYGVLSLERTKRPRAAAMLIYFWLFFQLVLLFTQKVLVGGLHLQRHSPSMAHYPWVLLSDALNIGNIKVYSHSCFPSGHALVLVFWASFTSMYCNAKVRTLVLTTTALLMLPRLFSGAHWLSDIIFTTFYGLLWFQISIGTPLYNSAINFIENKIRPKAIYEKCLH